MFDGLAAVAAAVDDLLELDVDGLSDDELTEALVALERQKARLCVAESTVLAAWDARRAWALDGARSGAALLAHRTRRPVGECRRQVWLARDLRDMPLTRHALAAGELSEAHASVLSRVRTSERAEQLAGDESMLVDHGRRLSFPAFRRAVFYWAQLADEAREADDPTEAEDQRRELHLSQTGDGWWRIDGWLDPITGTKLAAELARHTDQLWQDDMAAARAEHGDDVIPDDLARTPAQRRADAIGVIAERSASRPADARAPRPLITVLVDYETVTGRVCELADGTPLAPGRVAALLPQADIERVVFGPRSRVLDIGETARLFTGATRRAVEVRDRHCTWPGCDRPPNRCQIDHVRPAREGGPTTQANGALACGVHNRAKETDQFDVRRRPDGELEHRRGTGRLIE